MVPYLKGFHLTIEMWRGGRNIEGWKVRDDTSAGSSASLDSLDITKAGMGGRDLSLVDQVDNEDVADAAHRVRLKTGNGLCMPPKMVSPPQYPDFEMTLRLLSS